MVAVVGRRGSESEPAGAQQASLGTSRHGEAFEKSRNPQGTEDLGVSRKKRSYRSRRWSCRLIMET